MTFSAGLDIGVISASTEKSFEESLEDTKEKKWNLPAGQTSKFGFTPTLKCKKGLSPLPPFSSNLSSTDVLTTLATTGTLRCNKDSTGEACTGFKEAGENAVTYAVISTS